MMRVLLVHNFYQSSSPSGEDIVFENERRMLADAGNEVSVYFRQNDDIDDSGFVGKARAVPELFWSRRSFHELSEAIKEFRPDIAHFHNTFPLVSVSGYAACRANSIPIVQTLHNYRLICPNGLLLRDGRPCEICVGKIPLASISYGCYRDSMVASAAVSAMLTINRARDIYGSHVDRYIALTEFAAGKFRSGGMPAKRIVVKPNFLPTPPKLNLDTRGTYFVYVGRLGEEKGIRTLVSAWAGLNDLELKIVGDGPLRDEVLSTIGDRKLNIEYLGFRDRSEVLDLVAGARCQIVPSECYEGFPMVILEAFASATPVICSRIGSLQEIVSDGRLGLHFNPGDVQDLRAAVRKMLDVELASQMGRQARQEFEEKYTKSLNCEQLLSIYNSVLVESKVDA